MLCISVVVAVHILYVFRSNYVTLSFDIYILFYILLSIDLWKRYQDVIQSNE